METSDLPGRLPDRTLRLWRWYSVIGCLAVWAATGAAWWLWGHQAWFPVAAAAVTVLALASTLADLAWLLRRRWRCYRYEVTDSGTRIHQGLLFSRRLVVPANQILFAEVRQGPWQRRLGLATVRFGTLGSVHELGPVDSSAAAAVAVRLLERSPADAPL
jgi:membrane protein YdbS with pleckstrin-like domain